MEQNGHININLDFSNRGAPKYLSDRIREHCEAGYRVFKIRPKAPKGAKHYAPGKLFPNTCVPIAGTIDYFRMEHGCVFLPSKQYTNHPILGSSGIIEPYELCPPQAPPRAINAVLKFNPDTHHEIISSIISEFRQVDEMSENVIQSLELALNEVTDNIIQHSLPSSDSKDPTGYVMAQFHKSTKHIAVAVYDYGQGIQASLRQARRGLSSRASIMAALERGVTGGNGAGNGLWMMSEIVSASCGQFAVASDTVKFSLPHHDKEKDSYTLFSSFAPIKAGTTLVDFQLRSDMSIDFNEVLDGYVPTDLWYEDHLSDSLDRIHFSVRDEAKGVRSRRSSAGFVNLVLNTIKGKSEKCIIDFDGAGNMSASFADELFLSLVEKLGFVGFISRIELANLSQFNRAIVDTCMKVRFGRK